MRKPTSNRPLMGGAGLAAFAGLAILTSTGLSTAGTVTLNFGQTTTDGIPDASGNGTPFTVRLPGTGGYLAGANDPYMTLNTGASTLTVQTAPQPTDFNGGSQPNYIDAPGIDLASAGYVSGKNQDISATVSFEVPTTMVAYQQFVAYIGDGFYGSDIAGSTSDASAGLVRAGIIYGIGGNSIQSYVATNVGGTTAAKPADVASFDGAGNTNMQVAGTPISFTIYRDLGAWGAYYTLPSTSGTGTTTYAANFNVGQSFLSGPGASAPDLYAGITAINSGVTSAQFTTTVTGFNASVSAAPTFAAGQLVHDWNGASGNVNDAVGGANGTLESGATVSNGAIVLVNNANNVLTQQPGAGQYVQLPSNILPTSGSALTVQSWFTAATTDSSGGKNINWERVFDFGSNSGGNPTSTFFFTPHSSFANNVAVAGLWGAPDITGTANLADGKLHMVDVSLAQDGPNLTMQLYVDGQFVGATSAANMSLSSINDTLNYLGRSQFTGDAYFNGSISDFSVYNSLLSASQIASNFSAGVPAPVPEPASLALFCFAGAAMLLVRRKRKA